MSDVHDVRRQTLLKRLSKARPTKPGETYGVPGQGDTMWLSIGSILFLLFVWWLATTLGWI